MTAMTAPLLETPDVVVEAADDAPRDVAVATAAAPEKDDDDSGPSNTTSCSASEEEAPAAVASMSDEEQDSPAKSLRPSKNIDGFGPAIVAPRTESIDDKYRIDYDGDPLGRGLGTVVRRGLDRSTGECRAVKSINKKSNRKEYEGMLREANFLSELDHPDVVNIYDAYEDDECLHVVMDLCEGGDLYDDIALFKSNGLLLPERQVAQIVLKILDVLSYLHERGIAHRDLKLENVLFRGSKQMGRGAAARRTDVCLIDFDLAVREVKEADGDLSKLTACVGTNYFIAPEVLDRRYDHKCDVWSLGILTYCLLGAKPPFMGKDDDEIHDNIRKSEGVEFVAALGRRIGRREEFRSGLAAEGPEGEAERRGDEGAFLDFEACHDKC